MLSDSIDLKVGGDLQMEIFIGDKTSRFMTTIIGFWTNKSIIVQTPTVEGRCVMLREGLSVKGRLLAGSNIYGFSTRISAAALKPYPHLHLGFPKEFESLQVREVERVGISIPAELTQVGKEVFDESINIDLADISGRGALICASQSLMDVGDIISINCSVRMGEEERAIAIPATVRNVRTRPDDGTGKMSYLYGVQFNLKSHKDMLVVQGFVYEKILQSRLS